MYILKTLEFPKHNYDFHILTMDYAATSLMFNLSSLFENSVTKVGGAETSKYGPIPQFGDFRGRVTGSHYLYSSLCRDVIISNSIW